MSGSEAVTPGPAVPRHNPETFILSCVKGTGTGHSARALVGGRGPTCEPSSRWVLRGLEAW